MESPYVTKKLFRKSVPKLLKVKARRMMEGKKMTDMEALDEGLDALLQEKRAPKKKRSFWDGAGMISLKEKTDASGDLDSVIYTGE